MIYILVGVIAVICIASAIMCMWFYNKGITVGIDAKNGVKPRPITSAIQAIKSVPLDAEMSKKVEAVTNYTGFEKLNG